MEIPRHKVFISFQHGCEEVEKKCGIRITKSKYSTPLVWFNECQGYCDKSKVNTCQSVAMCQYWSICGHYWKERFEYLFTLQVEGFNSMAVGDGDIDDKLKTDTIREKIRDEFIADATVTVVLIGPNTWSRKHVDWEIGSSIRDTKNNARSGLLGIFLPTYPLTNDQNNNKRIFDPQTIPPRLYDNWKNISNRFAKLYIWSENPVTVAGWIHQAFLDRDKILPDNTFPRFLINRTGDRWQ